MQVPQNATVLDLLEHDHHLGITGSVNLHGQEIVLIGLDPGNSATKVSLIDHTGQLVSVRVPNCYLLAEEVKGGQTDVTWRINDGSWMWIGEAALKPPRKGNSVTQGATDVRLASPIQRDLIACSIVEALTQAHYTPGTIHVSIGYAVPTDEVQREDDTTGRMKVARDTRAAIQHHIELAHWRVIRRNERGKEEHWEICVESVVPQSQTLCAMICFTRTPQGALTTEYDGMVLYDFGHHDTQKATIVWKPKHHMTTYRFGDGMRVVAEDAIRSLDLDTNHALATNLLVNPQLMRRGRFIDIRNELDQVVAVSTEQIIQRVVEDIARTDLYIGFVGGGLHTFRKALPDRLRDSKKHKLQEYTDYRIAPPSFCVTLNSIGALLAARFTMAKRQRG